MDVLCIGHAAYDVMVPLPQFPEEDEKYVLEEKNECGGGPGANAAYLLATWDVSTVFMGQVGKDSYGEKIIRELNEAGVDLALLQVNHNNPTPFSAILVNRQNGSRTILNVRKPPKPLDNIDQLTRKLKPRVILMDGHELGASLKALEMYPEAQSILDAGSLKPATLELAGKVDYLITSQSFALNYCQTNSLSNDNAAITCLRNLQSLGKAQVVVTLGKEGLIYLADEKPCRLPAYPVKAVDTTGAGDVFHGSFAYGLLKGYRLLENLQFSSAVAALSVQQSGARTSIPQLEQVQAFMRKALKTPVPVMLQPL